MVLSKTTLAKLDELQLTVDEAEELIGKVSVARRRCSCSSIARSQQPFL